MTPFLRLYFYRHFRTLPYTTEDVIRLRSATGLSTHDVVEGLGIAMQHLLPPETVLIMRQLGRDWDEIRDIAGFMRDGLLIARSASEVDQQMLVPGTPKMATNTRFGVQIQEMAVERFAMKVSADPWQALHLNEIEFMYLVFAALIFGFSLEDALTEAQTMSEDQLRKVVEEFAAELHLPNPREFRNSIGSVEIPRVDTPLRNGTLGILLMSLHAFWGSICRRWGEIFRRITQGSFRLSLVAGSLLLLSPMVIAQEVPTLVGPAGMYDLDKQSPFNAYFENMNERIDPKTGSLHLTQTDLSLPGRNGLDLNLTRVYSSNRAHVNLPTITIEIELWTHSYEYVDPEYTWHDDDQCYGSGYREYWRITSYENWIYVEEQPVQIVGSQRLVYATSPEHIIEYACIVVTPYGAYEMYSYKEIYEYSYWLEEVSPLYLYPRYHLHGQNAPNIFHERYGLGHGWAWDFPLMEIYNNGETIILHMGDGRTYQATRPGAYSSTPIFVGYPFHNMRFESPSSACGCEYVVVTDELMRYEFGSQGELKEIYDRFGNNISFQWSNVSGTLRLSQIEDSVGRIVTFDYSTPKQVRVLIEDPNADPGVRIQGELRYQLENESSGVWKLVKVTDLAGREITYDYDTLQGNAKYSRGSYSNPVTLNNYFVALTEVVHPIGAGEGEGKTEYEWELARKFLDPASEQDPTKDPAQASNTTDYIRVTKRSDVSGGEVLNREEYEYLGWQTGPQRYVTERMIYKEGAILEETYEFDKEFNLVRLRQEGNQGETPRELRWTYDVLGQPSSKREIIGAYQQEERYFFDSRQNLIYMSSDIAQEQYTVYSHDHSFPLEIRQRIQNNGDVQWERTVIERDYTGAGARVKSTTLMETGEPLPQGTGSRMLAGWSKEIRRVGEIALWTTEGICQQIYINVSMKAEAPFQTVGYELAYQMRNDSSWTVVDSRTIQAGVSGDSHSSRSYYIDLPYEDFARVRVKVTHSGLGTSHVYATNAQCSKYTVYAWEPINQIKTEYDYYDNKPGALLQKSRVWLNDTGTEEHVTEYDYENVFNAYVSSISTTVTRPNGSTGEYRREGEYDFFGRLVVLREVENFSTVASWEQEFEYDPLGRLIKLKSPEIRFDGQRSGPYITTWEYNDNEPSVTVTALADESESIIEKRQYAYDPFGRLVESRIYL